MHKVRARPRFALARAESASGRGRRQRLKGASSSGRLPAARVEPGRGHRLLGAARGRRRRPGDHPQTSQPSRSSVSSTKRAPVIDSPTARTDSRRRSTRRTSPIKPSRSGRRLQLLAIAPASESRQTSRRLRLRSSPSCTTFGGSWFDAGSVSPRGPSFVAALSATGTLSSCHWVGERKCRGIPPKSAAASVLATSAATLSRATSGRTIR